MLTTLCDYSVYQGHEEDTVFKFLKTNTAKPQSRAGRAMVKISKIDTRRNAAAKPFYRAETSEDETPLFV